MERGLRSLVTAIVLTSVAAFFVALRCISRFVIIKRPGWEDYLIIIAFGLSVALTVIVQLQRQHGLGKHVWTLQPGDPEVLMKLLYISVIDYNLALFLVKSSILCQYLRLFFEPPYRRAISALLGSIVIFGTGAILTAIFSCTPVDYYWKQTRPDQRGTCIDLTTFWFTMAAFNILTDILTWIVPMPVLKTLHLPRKQKYGIMLVFTLGGFGCITSVLRLHSVYVASVSKDITWDNVGAVTWSSVELNVGIICACLPQIRPVLNLVAPKVLQTTYGSSGSPPNHPDCFKYIRNSSVAEPAYAQRMKNSVDGDSQTVDTARQDSDVIAVKHEWSVSEQGSSEQAGRTSRVDRS